MSKKHKTHDEKAHHEPVHHKTEEPKTTAPYNDTTVIAVVALILGLVIGGVISFGLFSMSQPMVVDNNTANQPGLTGVNLAEFEGKLTTYINNNFFADQNLLFEATDINSFGDGLYEVKYSISQDGLVVEEGSIYATKDRLVLGQAVQVLLLDEALPGPDQPAQPDQPAGVYTKSDKPLVDLFIMAFCPYGLQAVGAFSEPIQLLSDNIDAQLGYVIYPEYAADLRAKGYAATWQDYCTDENETYCSMHGINELHEDMRQLCIQKYYPDKIWPYMDLIVTDYDAQLVSPSNIESKWKGYAQQVGIDTAKIEQCQADEGLTLVDEQLQLDSIYGVQGSPTAIINGSNYTGGRTSEAFKQAVCSAFNTAPADCGQTLDNTGAAAAGSCS